MNGISPRYQMSIVQNINDRLFELYKSYEDVANYLDKWHIVYDCYGDNENFYFYFKDVERKKLDVKKTLHHIDGETLLKIAIDLGVETPDYIPSIPVFKNQGAQVIAATINKEGFVKVKATKVGDDTTFSQITQGIRSKF